MARKRISMDSEAVLEMDVTYGLTFTCQDYVLPRVRRRFETSSTAPSDHV